MSSKKDCEMLPITKTVYSDELQLKNSDVKNTDEHDVLARDDEDESISRYGAGQRQSRRLKRNKRRGYVSLSLLTLLVSFIVMIKIYHHGPNSAALSNIPYHPAFQSISVHYLEEYSSQLILYYHKKTKAELLVYMPPVTSDGVSASSTKDSSIVQTKEDKVFGVAFRTKPTDNSGVAHILEHSVLSGSKKYPLKDPFLRLLKGSLHTFLNAMTYNDRTVYPVASRNSKDFVNLMSVYLDAVFSPRCVERGGEWILQQEGWRFDFVSDDSHNNTSRNQGNSELVYKGVVYSEMKGVYSDPESVMQRRSEQLLFPDNTYHFDSGGDPQYIPTLSHEKFVEFYHTFYHPTNARIFLSGETSDIIKAMDMLDGYMKEYSLNSTVRNDSLIKFQAKHFSHYLYQNLPYAVTEVLEDEGQHMFTVTWLINDQHLDPKTELAFFVLERLLIGTPSSTLRKTLLESNFGNNIIGYGLDDSLLQMTFSFGMKGVKGKDIPALETLIFKVLRDTAENGFEEEDIAAAMNSLEFSLRELNTGSYPVGISIFLRTMTKWNYDRHPVQALKFKDALQALKKDVSESGAAILQKLLYQYFIDNNHRVHLEMYPSSTLSRAIENKEKERIQQATKYFTKIQYEQLTKQADHLKEIQSTPDPADLVATLPRLQLSDIDVRSDEIPVKVDIDVGGIVLTNTVASSNGIVYVDLGIDISSMPYNLIDLLPLFIRMLRETGTSDLTDAQLDRLIGINTGGIRLELLIQPVLPKGSSAFNVTDDSHFKTLLFMKGKCTKEKISSLFSLYKMMLYHSNINNQDKFIQIAEEAISSLKSEVTSSGHSFVLNRLQARYGVQAMISEKFSGISSLTSLQKILDLAHTNFHDISAQLTSIHQCIMDIGSKDLLISVTGDPQSVKVIAADVSSFMRSFSSTENNGDIDRREMPHPWVTKALLEQDLLVPLRDEGLIVPTQVSYVGLGGILYTRGETIHGSFDVVKQYLDKGYLWETVRAKNGAYGVMSHLDIWDGTFVMVSYRDPNLSKTLDAYRKVADSIIDDLTSGLISDEIITTSIIGAIGVLDGSANSPDLIGWKSLIRWLSGVPARDRQKWRDEILSTNVEDFLAMANRLKAMKNLSIALVSSESVVDITNESGNELNLTLIHVY